MKNDLLVVPGDDPELSRECNKIVRKILKDKEETNYSNLRMSIYFHLSMMEWDGCSFKNIGTCLGGYILINFQILIPLLIAFNEIDNQEKFGETFSLTKDEDVQKGVNVPPRDGLKFCHAADSWENGFAVVFVYWMYAFALVFPTVKKLSTHFGFNWRGWEMFSMLAADKDSIEYKLVKERRDHFDDGEDNLFQGIWYKIYIFFLTYYQVYIYSILGLVTAATADVTSIIFNAFAFGYIQSLDTQVAKNFVAGERIRKSRASFEERTSRKSCHKFPCLFECIYPLFDRFGILIVVAMAVVAIGMPFTTIGFCHRSIKSNENEPIFSTCFEDNIDDNIRTLELFHFKNVTKNFTDAQALCESHDGSLVTVDSIGLYIIIQQFVFQVTTAVQKNFYIGLSDTTDYIANPPENVELTAANVSRFNYVPNNVIEKPDKNFFKNHGKIPWRLDEPENDKKQNSTTITEQCVMMGVAFFDPGWVDVNCSRPTHVYCMRKCDEPKGISKFFNF